VLRRAAGNGEFPEREDGGPALGTALAPSGLGARPDGSVLIADRVACRVYRLAAGVLTVVVGSGLAELRHDDGLRAIDAGVCPVDVAGAPDGGFYVATQGDASGLGSEPRVRRVWPDGRIGTVAGTGRFSPSMTRWDEIRGDGMRGPTVDLRHVFHVDVLPDGGVVFSEGGGGFAERFPGPGLIRYLPPLQAPRLAVGVRRDRDRIFTPGTPASITVSLTAPAEVGVALSDGSREVAALRTTLPAGDTRIDVPPLSGVPHVVELTATDAAGRVAQDRADLLPRGWLADRVGRMVARGLIFSATGASSVSGEGVGPCRRIAPGRIDCAMEPDERCDVVATIRLGADGRLRWGTYPCPIGRHTRTIKRPRPLRRRDFSCSAPDCPPPLFGTVAPRWLVPWG
jgi:hypothetical protein